MNEIDVFHLSFNHDAYGYMLTYKGKPIGGARSLPGRGYSGTAVRSNEDYYKARAQLALNQISAGNIDPLMLKAIERIDAGIEKS